MAGTCTTSLHSGQRTDDPGGRVDSVRPPQRGQLNLAAIKLLPARARTKECAILYGLRRASQSEPRPARAGPVRPWTDVARKGGLIIALAVCRACGVRS